MYGYSFIVTNRDVSTPSKAVVVEHLHRHRTQVENISATPSSAPRGVIFPRGIPGSIGSGCEGALLAVSIAGWLHQLTAAPGGGGRLFGHGVREGQAMIAAIG